MVKSYNSSREEMARTRKRTNVARSSIAQGLQHAIQILQVRLISILEPVTQGENVYDKRRDWVP